MEKARAGGDLSRKGGRRPPRCVRRQVTVGGFVGGAPLADPEPLMLHMVAFYERGVSRKNFSHAGGVKGFLRPPALDPPVSVSARLRCPSSASLSRKLRPSSTTRTMSISTTRIIPTNP